MNDVPKLPLPVAASPAEVLAAAAERSLRGIACAMATVVERHGSAPGTPGQKLLLAADGLCLGSVGGGAVERSVLEVLMRLIEHGGAHEVKTYRLGPELGMCCGGRVTVMTEPILGLLPCFIVGAGHVATATAPLLAKVGFAVTVSDDREEWAAEERFPGVKCVAGDYGAIGGTIDVRGACLVMTRDHALDQEVIEWALKRRFAFVGGVGSKAKAERTRQRLEAKGFSPEDAARVRMPLGVPIHARSPEEIAVSIAGELIAWRRGHSVPSAPC